jgi:hypothetical protein
VKGPPAGGLLAALGASLRAWRRHWPSWDQNGLLGALGPSLGSRGEAPAVPRGAPKNRPGELAPWPAGSTPGLGAEAGPNGDGVGIWPRLGVLGVVDPGNGKTP